MKALELWFVRHGETDWNVEGRIQGQTNSQLTPHGLGQARKLAARLRGERFDHIYSSDSDRARDTARTVFPEGDIHFDARLRELSYGILEGKTEAEFTPEEADVRVSVRKDPFNRRVPEGETWLELIARVSAWLATLPESGRVIAFSHGGTIRAAIFSIVGHPQAYEWNLLFDNTGITRLRLSKASKVIMTLNDTAHLEVTDG